jgi:hypothetical protein
MTIDLWIGLGSFLLLALPLAHLTIYRRRYNRIEHVCAFARRLNLDEFEQLLDPAAEWRLRVSTSPSEFRRLQRQRMWLFSEYASRASHNAEIVQGWSYGDHSICRASVPHPGDEKTYLLWELSRTATEVRIVALVLRFKVATWLLLRADLLPASLLPSLAMFRTTAGLDLISSYEKMASLAKTVSQFYGPEWAEKIHDLF